MSGMMATSRYPYLALVEEASGRLIADRFKSEAEMWAWVREMEERIVQVTLEKYRPQGSNAWWDFYEEEWI